MATVNFGDEVRDKVTGFQGICISKHMYMHGCTRIGVQPKVKKDGKMPLPETFDEPALEIVKVAKVPDQPETRRTGGPKKFEPTGRSTGR